MANSMKPTPKSGPTPLSDVLKSWKDRGYSMAGGHGLGSFKKGGVVPKTGLYKLHKNETVVPAEATSGLGGKKKKSRLRMHIQPTDDNRFHVTHNYSGPEPSEETTHAPSSLEELLAHVKKHYSEEESEPEGDASEKA